MQTCVTSLANNRCEFLVNTHPKPTGLLAYGYRPTQNTKMEITKKE